jgi:hypothetical protein
MSYQVTEDDVPLCLCDTREEAEQVIAKIQHEIDQDYFGRNPDFEIIEL